MISNQWISIQKALLNNYDISQEIRNITMYNDIDNIGYVLELVYNDISDIRGKMPLKGGETLELILTKENKKFKKEFILYDLKTQAVDENNFYLKLSFISKSSFFLGINRINKSYYNTVSNIIKTWISVEGTTSQKFQVLIPGWTKSKAIKYLLNNFTKDYLFYETNSSYKLESLENLIIDSEYDDFVFSSKNPYYSKLILDINYKQSFNTLDDSYNNIYNRNIYSYNPNTKSFEGVNYNVKEIQESYNTFGSGRNYNEDITDNIFSKNINVPYTSNFASFNYQPYKLFNKSYEILIYGDIELEVGKTIRLDIKERFSNNLNNLDSGLYLITKIAHHISSGEYLCKLQIEKNAPQKDLESNIYKKAIM